MLEDHDGSEFPLLKAVVRHCEIIEGMVYYAGNLAAMPFLVLYCSIL